MGLGTLFALGTYDVSLIAINGDCPNDTAYTSLLVTDTYDIGELIGSTIEIYPNPASDWILIKSALPSSNLLINIYNASGKLVHSGFGNKPDLGYQLSISNFAAGVYQIELNNGNSSVLKQLVIE